MLNQSLKTLSALCFLCAPFSNAAMGALQTEDSMRTRSFQLKPVVWKNISYVSDSGETLHVTNFYAKQPGSAGLLPSDNEGLFGVNYAAWSSTGSRKTFPRFAARLATAKEGEARSWPKPGLSGTAGRFSGHRVEKQAEAMTYTAHPVSLEIDLGKIQKGMRWIGFGAIINTYEMSKHEDSERYAGYLVYDVVKDEVLDYMKIVERTNHFRRIDSLTLDQIIKNLIEKS